MRCVPHPYQRYCEDRIVAEERLGLFLDMGLGKTMITLRAVNRLLYDELAAQKVLIIAPKKVAEATWQAEAQKWDDLRPLRFSTILGTKTQRAAALARRADVYVINRDNVEWLADYLYRELKMPWPFDMVVCDESSSFKNPSSGRFRALKAQLPHISRVVLLTGTPAPNGVMDLWAQVYLLDQGARLGRTIGQYRDAYFTHNLYTHEFKAKDFAFDAVRQKIGDICVSMTAKDYLELPDMLVDDVPVALSAAARKSYRTLEKELLLPLADGAEITAATAAALTTKLLQLCNGSLYDAGGAAHPVHTAKLDALKELLEQLHGEHALLFYGFRHDIPGILDAAKGLRARELKTGQDVDAWNSGEVDILIAHPASCAYGLNLQQGGHHVIWYSLPWALELYTQANARLHRQGQEKPVIVHRLLVQGGMDEDVAKALSGKRMTQDALIDALKARISRGRGEGQ